MPTARSRFAAARLGLGRLEGRALLAIDSGRPSADVVPDPDLAFVTVLPTVDIPMAPSFSAGFAESDASQPWMAAAAEGTTGAIVYWLKLSVHEGVTTAGIVPIWGRLNPQASPAAAGTSFEATPGDSLPGSQGGPAAVVASIDGLVFGGPGSALAVGAPLTFADLAGFTPPLHDGVQEYFLVARSDSDFVLTALTAAFVLADIPDALAGPTGEDVSPEAANASGMSEPSGIVASNKYDPVAEDPLPAPVVWLQRLRAERPFGPAGDPGAAFPVTAASPAWLIDAQEGDSGAIVLWVTEQVAGGVASFRAVPIWVRFNPSSSIDPGLNLWSDGEPGASSVVVYSEDGQLIVGADSGPQPFGAIDPESGVAKDGIRTSFVVIHTESNVEIALTTTFLVLAQAPDWVTADAVTYAAGVDPLPLAGGIADNGQPIPLPWFRGLNAPAVAAPAVSLADDTGVSADDRITRKGRLAVDTAPGFRAQYSTDGGETWRRSFRARPGDNVVLVRQVDRDGLASPATTFEFTLDRRRPGAPRVGLAAGDDPQAFVATVQGSLVASRVETGARLEYSVNGRTWTPTFVPIDGMNSIRVRQVDVAGNASRPSVPVAVWRIFAAGTTAQADTPRFSLRPRWRPA
jgi:hypothetical protein